MNKTIKRTGLHILFWLVSWLFLTWFFTRVTREFHYTGLFTILLVLIAVVTTYVINYLLIPKFLLNKKYLLLALFSSFVLLVSLWLELLGIVAIFLHLLVKIDTRAGMPFLIDPVFLVAGLYLVVFAGVMIRLIKISFSMQAEKLSIQNRALETENKLKESELSAMRNHFHPHFLFNTLNNIYWLTMNKSDQAPQLVLKLSDLLDYSLYGCKNERVPLSKEIDYIRNYLDIMKIRFQDSSGIRFDIYGETAGRMMTPLIFINFVENAFKHGLATLTTGARIKIEITIMPASIAFNITNNYHPTDKDPDQPAGLGLVQVKSLLNLTYPDKHKLEIQKDEHQFRVDLILYE